MDKAVPDDAVSTLAHVASVPKKPQSSKFDYEEKKTKL